MMAGQANLIGQRRSDFCEFLVAGVIFFWFCFSNTKENAEFSLARPCKLSLFPFFAPLEKVFLGLEPFPPTHPLLVGGGLSRSFLCLTNVREYCSVFNALLWKTVERTSFLSYFVGLSVLHR